MTRAGDREVTALLSGCDVGDADGSHDVGTGLGQPEHYGVAETAASTGDNRAFIFEAHLSCSNVRVKLRRLTV